MLYYSDASAGQRRASQRAPSRESGGDLGHGPIRTAQRMLQTMTAADMGSVGKDEYAERMVAADEMDGAEYVYTLTGVGAGCTTDTVRSLQTDLEAANEYKVDHLKASIAALEKAREVYSFRFFGTASLEYIVIAASHCN